MKITLEELISDKKFPVKVVDKLDRTWTITSERWGCYLAILEEMNDDLHLLSPEDESFDRVLSSSSYAV